MALYNAISTPEEGIEKAQQLLARLESSGDASHLLREVIGDYIVQIDDDELAKQAEQYDQFPLVWHLCNSALERLCEQNLSEESFYDSLWNFASQSGLFVSDEDKALVMFCVLSNPRVPYACFDHPLMDDTAFEATADSLSAEGRVLRQIAVRSFVQKTQEAHAVLDVLERHASRDDKAVLLAMFLSFVRG